MSTPPRVGARAVVVVAISTLVVVATPVADEREAFKRKIRNYKLIWECHTRIYKVS